MELPKKIIYISHWRYPSAKASPRIAMRTCTELIRQGFEPEMWTARRQNSRLKGVDPFEYYHLEKNFPIHFLPVIDLTEMFPGKFWFFLMVGSFNVSVFFYTLWRGLMKKAIFYCLDFRDVVLLFPFKPNFFFEAHDFYKTPFDWLNRWFFTMAQGLTVTNRLKMEMFPKEYGIPQEKLLHKPCPVDTSAFRIPLSREEARNKLNVPHDETIILYGGQVLLWKGVDGLVDAHAYLKPKEVIYFIVGGDDENIKKEFREKCESLHTDHINVVEGQTHKDMPTWLRAADVLVLPNTGRDHASRYDTSPLKLFEYMASGRPIVASDLPSIRDIVDDRMVWFFEPDNPKAMADAIHAALENKAEAEKKSALAQTEAEKYTWERRWSDIIQFMRRRMA